MTERRHRETLRPLSAERLTSVELPPYRYVPGRAAHPRRDPNGHSFGSAEPVPRAVPLDGATDELFRYAVDLYNHRFFWEAHEGFESFWRLASRGSPEAELLQGIIQIAAANLKRVMDDSHGDALARRGLVRLGRVPDGLLGVDVRRFERETRDYFERTRTDPAALLLLQGTTRVSLV